MANPNIQIATTCVFNNFQVQLTSTNAAQIISNAATSNGVFVVDTINVANVDGTNAADITVTRFPTANGTGTGTRLSRTITVPANSSLIVVGSENKVNLKENQSIYVQASAANRLEVDANWKEYY